MARFSLFASAVLSVVAGSTAWGQRAPLAITDVTVIDGTGAAARPHMTVVIAGGRIVAMDSATRVSLPSDAQVIEGHGKFLIPGLWDMHVHLAKAGASSLGLFVANGVTSVRDMGGDFEVIDRWRSEITAGARIGPRITTAGPMLESATRVRRMTARGTVEPVARFRAAVSGALHADHVVDSVAQLGADHIKVRSAATRDTYLAVASSARRVGLPLVAHGDLVPVEDMLEAGQRSIEHAIYPPLQRRDAATRVRLIRELASAGVAVVPTMVNYYNWHRVTPVHARRVVDDSVGQIDPRRRYISGYLIEDWREQVQERGRVRDVLIRRAFLPRAYRGVLRDLQEMHSQGVRILPGTDVAVALMYPGFSLHEEMGLFVEKIGMTPSEALVSATRGAAEFSGRADSLGTLAIGKLADLVLLEADPLTDIRNVGRIHAVIIRGEMLDRSALLRSIERAKVERSGQPESPRSTLRM